MAKIIAEITHGANKACLYEPLTYEEWFNSHSYEWKRRMQTFRERPSREFVSMHQKAIARHLKQQGMMIKTFMRNCNGQRRTKTHQNS